MSDLYFIEEIAVADSGPRVGAFTITKGVVRQATKAEALRWAFTEECGTCGGNGFDPKPTFDTETGMPEYDPCPDCTDGRVLRDGVQRIWWCDFQQAADPTCQQWGPPTEHKECRWRYVMDAEWIEADDE